MWKPDESLDEFVVKAAPEIITEPPRPVSLCFTGEVEVLKPLARLERPAKPEPAAVDTYAHHVPHRLSWFHRSLALGGGLAIAAFIFVSAILIGIYDRGAELSQIDTAGDSSDIAIDEQPFSRELPVEEPLGSDIFTTAGSQQSSAFRIPRSKSSAKPRANHAAYRQRRKAPRAQPLMSAFVPTTLVIFIENGEIKTRIEPQLTAGYTKTPTLSN